MTLDLLIPMYNRAALLKRCLDSIERATKPTHLILTVIVIFHWIPADRLTRRFHRRGVIGRGISLGSHLRHRGLQEPAFPGIPRYQVGAALRGVRAMLFGSSTERHIDPATAQPHASTIKC